MLRISNRPVMVNVPEYNQPTEYMQQETQERKTKKRPVDYKSKKLNDYLRGEGIMLTVFSKKIGVSPSALYQILKGSDMMLSTAVAIEKATRGSVKIYDLLPVRVSAKKGAKKDCGE